MKDKNDYYICINCDHRPNNWLGKCPKCDEWNSIEKNININKENLNSLETQPVSLSKIIQINESIFKTYLPEFDLCLGGGLVKGSLVLLSGDPGVGKTTLLSCLLDSLASNNKLNKYLYISAEETLSQMHLRLQRLKISNKNIYLSYDKEWEAIQNNIRVLKPQIFIIDSIQTITSKDHQSSSGSQSLIKNLTIELMNFVKETNITCIVIGHINKENQIAGPKLLEHMVDVVLYLEGEKNNNIRILRSLKNRFSSTMEIGFFKMTEKGFQVNHSKEDFNKAYNLDLAYGTCQSLSMEGTRALLVEVESLVMPNLRTIRTLVQSGLPKNRVLLLLAICEKYLGLKFSEYDIYINTVGVLKLSSRNCDLAIIASLISSYKKISLNPNKIYIGELGLTGEIKLDNNIEEKSILKRFKNYQLITSKKFATDEHENLNGFKKYGNILDFYKFEF